MALSGGGALREARAFDQRREVVLVRRVAPAAVVVGFDPAKNELANRIPLHAGAVEPVDDFFLQRCEKALHTRIVEAAVRAAHALPDGTQPCDQHPVFLAGILASMVGMQDQTFLITVAGNRIAQGIAA